MTSYADAVGWKASDMTLRDYFAAQALGGMLASVTIWPLTSLEATTKVAYQIADAMLAERKKRP